MAFVIGQSYTREDIHARLGGSIQSYLPDVNGKVVCGCFVPGPAMNPNAPEEVLFGTPEASPQINCVADLVFEQGQRGEDIPTFIKVESSEWKYVGDYLCIGITRDARVIAQRLLQWPKRGPFHGVLRFARV